MRKCKDGTSENTLSQSYYYVRKILEELNVILGSDDGHNSAQKMKTADLVIFIEEILNGKLHFLCSVRKHFLTFQ